jgi:IS5 family transposase
LRKAGAVEKLFDQFDTMLAAQGFGASGGQIIDATCVEVPRQRNNRDDNTHIKETGTAPADWSEKKKAHKDVHARWTKKNKQTFYGYKNHANIDRKHKVIRRYTVTDASVHDSQECDSILDPRNDCQDTWADSAYRSAEQEARLKEKGVPSHIHERAYRNTPLTEEQKESNTEKLVPAQAGIVRARCEHVFGHIETAMKGCFVRTIGIARATAKIGLENIAYNMSRFTFLMGDKIRRNARAAPA